jgi:hypothetical protein
VSLSTPNILSSLLQLQIVNLLQTSIRPVSVSVADYMQPFEVKERVKETGRVDEEKMQRVNEGEK